MKIGIITNTNEPETVWNAFRFGVTFLLMEHEVKVWSDFCMRHMPENKADEGKRGLPDLYNATTA